MGAERFQTLFCEPQRRVPPPFSTHHLPAENFLDCKKSSASEEENQKLPSEFKCSRLWADERGQPLKLQVLVSSTDLENCLSCLVCDPVSLMRYRFVAVCVCVCVCAHTGFVQLVRYLRLCLVSGVTETKEGNLLAAVKEDV